jgi:hypothetical protein
MTTWPESAPQYITYGQFIYQISLSVIFNKKDTIYLEIDQSR